MACPAVPPHRRAASLSHAPSQAVVHELRHARTGCATLQCAVSAEAALHLSLDSRKTRGISTPVIRNLRVSHRDGLVENAISVSIAPAPKHVAARVVDIVGRV